MAMEHQEMIYQAANHLADLLRQSPEYAQYMAARKRLQNDPLNRALLRDLRDKQYNLQMGRAGVNSPEQRAEYIQDMMMSAALSPTVNEFLNAEFSFSRIVENLGQIFNGVFPSDDLLYDDYDDYDDDEDEEAFTSGQSEENEVKYFS